MVAWRVKMTRERRRRVSVYPVADERGWPSSPRRLFQKKNTGTPSNTIPIPIAALTGCVAMVFATSAPAATMNASGVQG
jgi:hypothetical protein